MGDKYDIFLSYRRNDNDGHSNVDTARAICYEFRDHGLKVFFDFEKCTDGYFSSKILPAIRTCKYFVLVLTKDALSRCVNKNDWVRREIEEAINHGRKIIPISPDGEFPGWPKDLPQSLMPLFAYDGGLQVSTIHRDASFKSDVRMLIDQRMGGVGRVAKVKNTAGIGIGGGLIVAGLIAFFVMNGKNSGPSDSFPITVVADSTKIETRQETSDKDERREEMIKKNNKSEEGKRKKDDGKKNLTSPDKVGSDNTKAKSEDTLALRDSSVIGTEPVKIDKTQSSSKREFKKARDLFNSGNYKQALIIFEKLKSSGVSEPNLNWYIEACKEKI